MTTLLLIVGIALSISFACSILEAVFLSITHSYVAILKNRGEWAGAWLEKARKNVDEPIAAILTLNTIAHTIGATMGGAKAAQVFGDPAVGVFSGVLTLVVLLGTEIVPKTIGATYWKQLAKPTAYVLQVMVVGMKPVLIPLGWVSRLLTRSGHGPTVSRAEIEVLAEIGRREGTLDDDEFSVVTNVIRLDQVSVGEVMTPRTDMIGIPATATVAEAQTLMLDTGHLRLPVFEENLDTITGVILARDVWRAQRSGRVSLEEVIRPIPFAPASKRVEDLIPEMRAQLTKMAVVVDEFGGTAGLVTLEDLIEEIIGEIQDEHEGDEPAAFQELSSGRVRIWGGTSLRESSQHLGFEPTEDEEEGFETIGGLVFGRLNRIPVVGDEVALDAGTLRVTQMSGRRIEYLLYDPAGEESGEV
jgi:magnesium and cobalt exporter, CNNM family